MGKRRGRPRRNRVFVNNNTLNATFQNMPKERGGGAIISVDDKDELFTTNIIDQRPHQLSEVKIEEQGGILAIKGKSKSSGKETTTLIAQIPNDPALKINVKQGKMFRDIKKQSVSELKEKYSLADLRSFAQNYNIKAKSRKDEKAELIRRLKKLFEQDDSNA